MTAPAPLRPLQTFFPVWERRAGLGHLLSSEGSSESQWTGPRCPSVHLLLPFAHLHERVATHASLFKFLRSPAGKAPIELCGQTRGSWNSFYTHPLLEHLLVPHDGTCCANTGLAGPGPRTGGWIRCPLTRIPPALGEMTGQGSWQSPCLLPCSSCSGPGPLCWRIYINV